MNIRNFTYEKFLFLLCFLVSAFVATATDPYVTIGTNRFGFVFEDTTLSTNMQARIIDDWKNMTMDKYYDFCKSFFNK